VGKVPGSPGTFLGDTFMTNVGIQVVWKYVTESAKVVFYVTKELCHGSLDHIRLEMQKRWYEDKFVDESRI